MKKINTVLGIDTGTNSLGWALFEANEKGQPLALIDMGVRIFQMAVEDKTPTPKNQARRQKRMARRVLQRRTRRKQRMLNYLVSLNLLPTSLKAHTQPEIMLNDLGNPYQLRADALDQPLTAHEVGRVMLHLVQRRGFQSNRKTLLGDMIDDPDAVAVLAESSDDSSDSLSAEAAKEEKGFLAEVQALRDKIDSSGFRTLGEYLNNRPEEMGKRNRKRNGGDLRTDRQMYKDEFWAIINAQKAHHPILEDGAEELFTIIFHQRPLKLKKDRVGRCSLEPQKSRAKKAWRCFQEFRYLQDINSIKFRSPYSNDWQALNAEQRQKLVQHFERNANITITTLRKLLGYGKEFELNYDAASVKKFRGNTTVVAIREVYPHWDDLSDEQQNHLEIDLITYESKAKLKQRLMKHWGIDESTAIQLCVLEFEPEHANLSVKAINKLLPHMREGALYSSTSEEQTGALQLAGYQANVEKTSSALLGRPPELPNPIVNKSLHEIRRLVNALIKQYGKPDFIRVEMARDLEMNTKRYKGFIAQQNKNTKLNDEADEQYRSVVNANPQLGMRKYASREDKLRYRLWQEQDNRCAYSGQQISKTQLFTAAVEVDHIIPYSLCLNDSYMNKVVCLASENQIKGQKTPFDAFSGDEQKWTQIEQRIQRWYAKGLGNKRDAFYQTADSLEGDFISRQLNDVRYISREALVYLQTLGSDVSVVKGQMTSWLRHNWGMNSLIDDKAAEKDRSDHRHHAIDAAAIACTDRRLYKRLVSLAKDLERSQSSTRMNDLNLPEPYDEFRQQVGERLNSIIVSHASNHKVNGQLHEESGLGYKAKLGGTVYRKDVDENLTAKAIKNIIDPVVKKQVEAHLAAYDGKPKLAFAQDKVVLHKDNRTPIKRVRILASQTNREKLDEQKLPVKNSNGDTFKWMTFGNTHHVDIFKHIKTGKYEPRFMTAYVAMRRVHGKQAVYIKALEGHEYCFSLHINDMVHTNKGIYRVQKIEGTANRLMLRLHAAAKIDQAEQAIHKSIPVLVGTHKMQPCQVNILGLLTHDGDA